MCIALPGKIVAISGEEADVLVRETIRKAGLQLYPETQLGDYVLVKSGLVVQVLPESEALSLIAFLDEMLAFLDSEAGEDGADGADADADEGQDELAGFPTTWLENVNERA